MFSEISN